LFGGTTADTGAWLKNLLETYGKSTNLAICPIITKNQPAGTGGTTGGNVEMPWLSELPRNSGLYSVGAYGYNGWLFSDQAGNGNGAGYGPSKAGYFIKDTDVKNPAETPMFFEEEWTDCWPLETDAACHDLYLGGYGNNSPPGGGANTPGPNPGMSRVTISRHGKASGAAAPRNVAGTPVGKLPGAINMGFNDGHASLVQLRDLWGLPWHAKWNPALIPPGLSAQ
jgi:hypothetical protein